MSTMTLRRIGTDKARYHLWPIRFGFSPRLMLGRFSWHGWQTHVEDVPDALTSFGYIQGKRAVFGQTLSFGFFQVMFGPDVRP